MLPFPVFLKQNCAANYQHYQEAILMSKNTTKHANSLRIIGGKWRSRKVSFPDVEGLRPTADRVRETLFNWLQETIMREDCLDLFTGSGACGLEALSRGARHVSFVDSSHKALDSLRANLKMLEATDYAVYCEDALTCLRAFGSRSVPTHDGRYGLVFLDPPFASDLLQKSAESLENSGILRENAFIYIESDRDITAAHLPANWRAHKYKRAGKVYFGLFVREAATQS